ncbi:WhiB family transcriptional regulator [Rhodococcus phenolicus]|uniref:WhiB family transcriptional regulator n=1 Tax=Rhodococcus phenolicus TaxID=263849 RepID=UPI000837977D|nr:WhiB family transcriptional regulator [Rhodococcus phenolicus]
MSGYRRQVWPAVPELVAGLIDPALIGAACVEQAPLFDEWIDGEAKEQRHARHAAALAVCRACPVTGACRAAAADHDAHGIWGGTLYPIETEQVPA